MKTLVICHSSHHNNTLKISRAMADILNADIRKPTECDVNTINEYDLIGFGSGIYAGKHHESLFQLVKLLPSCKKKAFIFSTRAIQTLTFYHKILRKRLEGKGLTILNEFSCQGFSTYGPLKFIGGINKGRPNTEDIEKARLFAQELKKLLDT